MPNWCKYEICVVSKDKASIERFGRILHYEDNEYYLYRVLEANTDEAIIEENGYYYQTILGHVAWSAGNWFRPDDERKPSENGAVFITLTELTKKLSIAVEIFSEESGCCFAEHIACNDGIITINEYTPYTSLYAEDKRQYDFMLKFVDKDFANLPKEERDKIIANRDKINTKMGLIVEIGGYYQDFSTAEEIYKGEVLFGRKKGVCILS